MLTECMVAGIYGHTLGMPADIYAHSPYTFQLTYMHARCKHAGQHIFVHWCWRVMLVIGVNDDNHFLQKKTKNYGFSLLAVPCKYKFI